MADGSISSSADGMPTSASPTLSRWLMPSISDLLFVAILATLVFTPLSIKLLNDAGTGWHIRTGQIILANHEIPTVDPFSSQTKLPWFAWEWLYDVVVGALDAWCGLNGVVWFTAFVIAAAFAWSFRLLLSRGTNLAAAIFLTLVAIGASMIHFLARPHVLSWLFVVASFWVLEETGPDAAGNNRRRKLWFLPPLIVVWVNVHGGFLVAFVLLLSYWLGSLRTWWNLNESRIEESLEKISAGKRSRDLFLVGLASLAASLVNPYGWKLHAHIYSYLTNHFLMSHIDEFQSPNFHKIAPRCFLLLLLISVAVLAVCARRFKLSHTLLVLFAIYAGLYSARNIPISSILLLLVIGPHVPSIGPRAFLERMRSVDSRLKGHLWPLAAVVVTFVVASVGSKLMEAHFDPQRMPVDAVNYLESKPIDGPVLAPDYWGGYLIYRLYPHNKVVVDDRHDFYGEQFLKSYLTAIHVEPGWDQFLKDRTACIVLPKTSALASILATRPDWKAVYADDLSVVFLPTK